MKHLDKFLKKWAPRKNQTHTWSDEAVSQQIIDLANALNKDLDLINKPVTTTNEQPKISSLYKIVSKLTDIRNSDDRIPREVYHKICDLEQEIVRLVV